MRRIAQGAGDHEPPFGVELLDQREVRRAVRRTLLRDVRHVLVLQQLQGLGHLPDVIAPVCGKSDTRRPGRAILVV
jgi:hypothetical protein